MGEPSDLGTFGRYGETSGDRIPPQLRDAHESTRALRGLVPVGLYRRARRRLVDTGIVDATVLIRWFTTVRAILKRLRCANQRGWTRSVGETQKERT